MKKFGRPNDGPGFVRNRNGDDRGYARGGRGGFDERPTQRPFGRPEGGRPNNFASRGSNDERPQCNTYRREDGQRGGYGGRPSQDRGDFRQARPQASAPPREPAPYASAPQAAPVRAPQAGPVPAAALKNGIAQANKALGGVIEQFGSTIRGDYDISQVEVAVSFDADGRFVGFGSGAAVSFTLTVTPLEGEDVFSADEDTQGGSHERTFEVGESDFEEAHAENLEASDEGEEGAESMDAQGPTSH